MSSRALRTRKYRSMKKAKAISIVILLILLVSMVLPASCGGSQTPEIDRLILVLATAENWDPDPEKDGIEVLLRPVDSEGDLVRTEGSIDITLSRWTNPGDTNEPPKGEVLEEWHVSVTLDDYSDAGTLLTLEYQQYVPQDSDYGWIEVELTTKQDDVFTVEGGVIDSLS